MFVAITLGLLSTVRAKLVILNYENCLPHGHSGTRYLRVLRIERDEWPCQQTGAGCRPYPCKSVLSVAGFSGAGAVAVALLIIVDGYAFGESVAMDAQD